MKYKLILAVFTILIIISRKPVEVVAFTTDMLPKVEMTAEQYIEKIFGKDARIAKAVLMHESQNNYRAKNWNCRYGGKSTFCKKEDRPKAWSVDCGFAQINVKGTVCPEELFTLEGTMKAVEEKYKTQGLNAWISYRTGAYKKYL